MGGLPGGGFEVKDSADFFFLGTYVSRLLGFFLITDSFSKDSLIILVVLVFWGGVTPGSIYHVTRFINGEEVAV